MDVDSKIEAETSPTRTRIKVDSEATLWCNATGYPPPVVYWTRQDRHRQLQDGSHQYWVRSDALHCTVHSSTCFIVSIIIIVIITYSASGLVQTTRKEDSGALQCMCQFLACCCVGRERNDVVESQRIQICLIVDRCRQACEKRRH